MLDPVDDEHLERVQLTTSVLLTNAHGPEFIDVYREIDADGVQPNMETLRRGFKPEDMDKAVPFHLDVE